MIQSSAVRGLRRAARSSRDPGLRPPRPRPCLFPEGPSCRPGSRSQMNPFPRPRPRPRPGCLGDERPQLRGELMTMSVGTTPGGTTPAATTPAGTTPELEVRRSFPAPATPRVHAPGPQGPRLRSAPSARVGSAARDEVGLRAGLGRRRGPRDRRGSRRHRPAPPSPAADRAKCPRVETVEITPLDVFGSPRPHDGALLFASLHLKGDLGI